MNEWKGQDPRAGEGDETEDAKRMVHDDEALEEIARRIAEGDYAGARRDLDALDQPQEAEQLGAEELLAAAMEEKNAVAYLRRELNERDPTGDVALAVQTDWTGDFKRRDWLCPKWLPAGRVTMLTGSGGGGKSLLALHLAVTVISTIGKPREPNAKGRAVLADKYGDGKAPTVLGDDGSRPVVFATWEDENDEFLRRLHWLPDCDREQLGTRLHVVDLTGSGPIWGPLDRRLPDSVATLTPIGAALEAYVRASNPRLVVIDPVAGAYGANENDRSAVRAWLSHLNRLAADTGAAILLVAHPSKNKESQDYSGSTDWRAGIRALWTLKPEPVASHVGAPNMRTGDASAPARGYALTLAKANYAKDGRRAWLRLRVEHYEKSDVDRPPLFDVGDVRAMVWEECSALEALEAYHAWRGWNQPKERGQKTAKSRKSEASPEHNSEPEYVPPYTDQYGLAQ